MFNLEGRTAIVTGGSRGIGFEIVRKLASSGMRTVILGAHQESVKRAMTSLAEEQLICDGFICDITDILAIDETVQQIYKKFNSIDVLVNCAGILDKTNIEELTELEWDSVIDTNLKGTFFMIQKTVPYLKKSICPRIINISSNAGRMGGYENGLAYTASKGGIISLTYGAARRLAPYGITVNCIAPGTIETDMSQEYDMEAHQKLLKRFPLGRLGNPEEVAASVCYFASEEASFTTGAVLDINGGMFMG